MMRTVRYFRLWRTLFLDSMYLVSLYLDGHC